MSFSSPVRRTTSSSSRPSEETGWNTLVSGTSSHVVPRRSLRHRKTNQDSPITASNLRSIVGPQSSQTSTQNSTSTVMDTDWNQVGLGPSTSDDSPDLFESSLSAADAKPGHPFRLRPRSPTTQPGTASPIKVDEMDVNDPVLSDIVTSDAAESKSSQSVSQPSDESKRNVKKRHTKPSDNFNVDLIDLEQDKDSHKGQEKSKDNSNNAKKSTATSYAQLFEDLQEADLEPSCSQQSKDSAHRKMLRDMEREKRAERKKPSEVFTINEPKKRFRKRKGDQQSQSESSQDDFVEKPKAKKAGVRKAGKLAKGQGTLDKFVIGNKRQDSSSTPSPTILLDDTEDDERWKKIMEKEEELKRDMELVEGLDMDDSVSPEAAQKTLQKIRDVVNAIKEQERLSQEEDAEDARLEEERKKRDEAEKKFENECNRLRDRLEDEVDEEKMRALVKENFEFIDQLWEGKIESTRYTAYKKGGDTRNGLIYRIMTSAFSDNHYKWMMDEITKKYMPTIRLQTEHSDFIWKVVVTEVLIKIYMDFFGFDKLETERRMRNTSAKK